MTRLKALFARLAEFRAGVLGHAARAPQRRLKWEIFPGGIRNGVGVIVTDLDTEQFAAGSARTERAARRLAAHRLAVSPSGATAQRWAR